MTTQSDRGGRAAADVALDPEFQAEVLEKERQLSDDHFSVLGISPRASAEEIRAAYHAASKRFHPDRFFRKELGAFGPKLERIFRRLSEANAVLSDPGKREAYFQAHPQLREAAEPPSVAPERVDERRSRLARHPYLMKASRGREALLKAQRLVQSHEPSLALEILAGILHAEPLNEEAAALVVEARGQLALKAGEASLRAGELAEQEGNVEQAVAAYQRALVSFPQHARAHARLASLLAVIPGRLDQARVHAKTACELEPKNPDHRALMARVLVALGAKRLARKELEVALELAPQHREANQLLKKVRWSLLRGE